MAIARGVRQEGAPRPSTATPPILWTVAQELSRLRTQLPKGSDLVGVLATMWKVLLGDFNVPPPAAVLV